MFLLLASCRAVTTADLIGPFEQRENRKLGHWEFAGSTELHKTRIMLVPPVQFHLGSGWTYVKFPTSDWAVNIELNIVEGTGGGGFAIWFASAFGSTGTFYGASKTFSGLCVLVDIVKVGLSMELNFYLLQSPVMTDASEWKKSHKPDKTMKFWYGRHINLNLNFKKGQFILNARTDSNEYKELMNRKLAIDITDKFMGITAQNDQTASRIDLYQIDFDVPYNTMKLMQHASVDQAGHGHFHPDTATPLRSPALSKVAQYMDLQAGPSGINDVMDIITEIMTATQETASFSDVNTFIRDSIVPFTDKWHRRTLKLLEHMKNIRSVMTSACNMSGELLRSLNATLSHSSMKMSQKILTIEEIINEEYTKEDEQVIVIRLNANNPMATSQVIMLLLLLESFIALTIIIMMQNRRVQDRVFQKRTRQARSTKPKKTKKKPAPPSVK